MKLYAPSTIHSLREKYNFRFSRSLGQNFLADQHIVDKIVEYSYITDENLVIEIGAGIGVLTAAAAARARKVIAIELDHKLIPILKETLSQFDNIDVIQGDVLETNFSRLIEGSKETRGVKIIGNLPYYISTPVIMKILEEGIAVDSITVMMQREVAERIMSSPGSKSYGALTIAVQYYCTIEQVAKVPRDVFIPKPKVDSIVLRLDVRRKKPFPLICETIFFSCIRAGFGQRRKTLCNALTGTFGLSKTKITELLSSAGIDPRRRAETLSIEEFGVLANTISGYIIK